MKITRQSATITASVAAVLAIAGGGAWALSGGDAGAAQQQVQPADTAPVVTASPSATDSPSATATASPTDIPTTAAPSTSAPTTTPPPATTAAPTPTTSKKAATLSTPTSDPAPDDPNRVDPTNPNNENNGGHGTVDNGPYPSSNITATVIPDPYPVQP